MQKNHWCRQSWGPCAIQWLVWSWRFGTRGGPRALCRNPSLPNIHASMGRFRSTTALRKWILLISTRGGTGPMRDLRSLLNARQGIPNGPARRGGPSSSGVRLPPCSSPDPAQVASGVVDPLPVHRGPRVRLPPTARGGRNRASTVVDAPTGPVRDTAQRRCLPRRAAGSVYAVDGRSASHPLQFASRRNALDASHDQGSQEAKCLKTTKVFSPAACTLPSR